MVISIRQLFLNKIYTQDTSIFKSIITTILKKEKESVKEVLLTSLMYSEIDIFTDWFKSILHELSICDSKVLKQISKNIQNTYRDYFLRDL